MTQWTRETLWRQGHLLTEEAAVRLGFVHSDSPDDTLVIVASHDCDLAQLPGQEPNVEVVVGRKIVKLDGNYTNTKSARKLHIAISAEGDPLLAEFVITDKQLVPKSSLSEFSPRPGIGLAPNDRSTFQRWLAVRYRRAAFPDEFERRLKDVHKLDEKISRALKQHGELITAIFFDVDGGLEIKREGPEDVYFLDILLVYTVDPDPDAGLVAAMAAKDRIEKAFEAKLLDKDKGEWKDIELGSCDVISEEALTYRQSKMLKQWRLEHISFGSDPQQPIIED